MSASPQLEPPATDERRGLVQRIAASPGFARAPKLTEFFLYVCERALDGRADEISEHQIGVRVFNRAADYNSNDDSIVRSHARLLRQRIDAYFEEPGKDEEFRILIPKGRYVPVFEQRQRPLPKVLAPVSELPPPALRSNRRWFPLAAAAGAGILILLVLLVASQNQPAAYAHRFWKNLFKNGKNVFVVPADSTLALIEDATGRSVGLTDYLNRSYRFGLDPALLDIAARQYTSMADLNLTVRLLRLGEAGTRQIDVRYARNLQLADLKASNAILIGGPRANPWQELFENKLNFHLDVNPGSFQNSVINKSPQAGESSRYNEPRSNSSARAYGILAFLPGLNSSTRTLIVQGTSSVGTECAADFLVDDLLLGAFLQRISANAKFTSYFELLLQADTVGGNARQPQIVAYRIVKP